MDVVTKVVNFIRTQALNHRQCVALLEEHETEQADLAYHTADTWLSLGKVLKQVWDLNLGIQEFWQMKGKALPELTSADWLADLAFAVDITALMNCMQNCKKRVSAHEMYSLVKAFMRKLLFLS